MAARDIINNGPLSIYNFQWRYCDMDFHRKDYVAEWSRISSGQLCTGHSGSLDNQSKFAYSRTDNYLLTASSVSLG